jgi:hypothetical protein
MFCRSQLNLNGLLRRDTPISVRTIRPSNARSHSQKRRIAEAGLDKGRQGSGQQQPDESKPVSQLMLLPGRCSHGTPSMDQP